MKFVTLFILFCVCICFGQSVNVVTWGSVNGSEIGTHTVTVKSSMWQVQRETFTFPGEGASPYQIGGIKHVDYKQHPVKVVFKNGGIGQNTVTLYVESQRGHGINSTFTFYRL